MNKTSDLTIRPSDIEAGYPPSKLCFDKFCEGESISRADSETLFDEITRGSMNQVEIAALLVALKIKGETPEEIAGAAAVLQQKAAPFVRPETPFADCCGTGGDGALTFNISTAAGFTAAACGLPVAKHGNRSVSSRAGSADVLEALGANISLSPDAARRCLDETGFCFLFAPDYHPAMRHVAPVRRELKTRTVFNILGPLANPAHPPFQLVGVYEPALCRPMAETLNLLGCKAAIVVHGGGVDEVAVHDETRAALLKDGKVSDLTLTPGSLGLPRHDLAALEGGSAADNAALITAVLGGKRDGAAADVVAANAGVLLFVAGLAGDARAGVALAKDSLAAGRPLQVLEQFVRFSQRVGNGQS